MSNRTTLDRQTVIELARALALVNQPPAIVTTGSDAQVTAAKAFLSERLNAHADEFLGAWIAVHDEYEPALQIISRIQRRLAGVPK